MEAPEDEAVFYRVARCNLTTQRLHFRRRDEAARGVPEYFGAAVMLGDGEALALLHVIKLEGSREVL